MAAVFLRLSKFRIRREPAKEYTFITSKDDIKNLLY
jgi:hypothetical protein